MRYKGHCIGRMNDVLEPVYGWSKPYEFQYDGNGNIKYWGEVIAHYKFNRGTDIPEIEFLGKDAEYNQKLYQTAIADGRVKNQLQLVQKISYVLHYKFQGGEWHEFGLSHGGFRSFDSAASWMEGSTGRILASTFVEQIVNEAYE